MNITQKPISASNWSFKDSYKAGICFHWIVGNLYSADSTFNNPNRKASAHFGVGDNPGEVHQYVPISKVAYHAGDSDSFWENGYFIGIEHSGGEMQANGQRRIPSDQCVQNSIELCVDICRKQGWDRLVLPYSYDLLNQDPTTLIEQYRGQRVGIAVRHNNVANTGTACSGSLGVEYIVNKVNEILSGGAQTIPTINVKTTDDMLKEKLIMSINNNPDLDDSTKQANINATYEENGDYLVAFLGAEPRKRVKELETQLANQVPVKIMPTDEEIKQIILDKGYKTPEEVNLLITDAINGIKNQDPLDNPIIIAPPTIELPPSKKPLDSKTWTITWTSILSVAYSIQAILSQASGYADIISSMLVSVAGLADVVLDPAATHIFVQFILYAIALGMVYLIYVIQRVYVIATKKSESDVKNLFADLSNKLFTTIADINNRRPTKPIIKSAPKTGFFSFLKKK